MINKMVNLFDIDVILYLAVKTSIVLLYALNKISNINIC